MNKKKKIIIIVVVIAVIVAAYFLFMKKSGPVAIPANVQNWYPQTKNPTQWTNQIFPTFSQSDMNMFSTIVDTIASGIQWTNDQLNFLKALEAKFGSGLFGSY